MPPQDGALCGPDGLLNQAAFEVVMRQQLRQYAGRRLSDFLAHTAAGEAERAQVLFHTSRSASDLGFSFFSQKTVKNL